MAKKNTSKEQLYTQQMINLKRFVPLSLGDGKSVGIETEDGKLLVYLQLRPDNISVLGRTEVLARIRNLQNVLQDIAEIEMLCISSSQNYENNKRYYRDRAENAANEIIRDLCLREIDYLEEINISMSTSREFALILKYNVDRLEEAKHAVLQAVQLIKEHRFRVEIASEDKLKRLLSIYYVGDIYSQHIPDYDGMQYFGKEN